MRFDKFTTKFQQALADAQSLANGNDQQFIEPQHLLLALINQDDGGTTSLLGRAGVNVPALKRDMEQALTRLPFAKLQQLWQLMARLDDAQRRFDTEQAWLMLQTLALGFRDGTPLPLAGSVA